MGEPKADEGTGDTDESKDDKDPLWNETAISVICRLKE